MTDIRNDATRTTRLRRLTRFTSRVIMVALALLVGALGMRAWMLRNAPDLKPWHTLVPEELDAGALAHTDWTAWLKAEDLAFAEVSSVMQQKLDDEDRTAFNRYNPQSRVYPGRFAVDWNRSFVLEPSGDPAGVVVLLHGLTDAPYSLRHVAQLYRAHGFVAIGLRTPAHGTVPGALARTKWQDWDAAVHMAMREAARRSGGKLPVHIVGYSNGGALAVKYTLDTLEDPTLLRPARVVLLSPMIGITPHARFAGIAGWPAVLPAFAKTAWLDNLPEFNPFKYNSFPVNAARHSYLLTDALQRQIVRLSETGRLAQLPPILTFQSMVDATVRSEATIDSLYKYLPANGSELVLFDINRNVDVRHLLRPGALTTPAQLLAAAPYNFRVTVVGNADPQTRHVVARVTAAGTRQEVIEPLDLAFPPDVFSLSHIAVPFPIEDGLYGLAPDPQDDFGIRLGELSMRGERGVLVNGIDVATVRISSNPFFPFVAARIASAIEAPAH